MYDHIMAMYQQDLTPEQANAVIDDAFEEVGLNDEENLAAEDTPEHDVKEANPEHDVEEADPEHDSTGVIADDTLSTHARSTEQDLAQFFGMRANDGLTDSKFPTDETLLGLAIDRSIRDQVIASIRADRAKRGLPNPSSEEMHGLLGDNFREETARMFADRDGIDRGRSISNSSHPGSTHSGSTHSVSTHSTSATLSTIRQPCWVRSLTKLIDILSLPIGASLLKWYLITRGFLAPTNEPLPQVPERVFVLFQRVMASVAVFLPLDWPLLLLQGVAWIPFFIKALVSVRDWLSIRCKQDDQSIGRTALFLTALVGVAYAVTPPKS